MTSSWEWVGYVPAAWSAVHALGAVWRRSWAPGSRGRSARRTPAGEPAEAGGTGVPGHRPCGCAPAWVVRYEAADGSVLTVWAERPDPAAACREEPGLW
ncbi:hypothetical protein [Streptomyces sp. NPDC000410]|uniref:hypothetical protein n=1 Tax=Streptomyces sp. NPDC000410 TaxID=3154254 RepID=UPI003322ABF7